MPFKLFTMQSTVYSMTTKQGQSVAFDSYLCRVNAADWFTIQYVCYKIILKSQSMQTQSKFEEINKQISHTNKKRNYSYNNFNLD